ncbi:bacillithiol system redox-active protein YtxJ [Flavobacterium tibetense]|uniref:Bacillithiol system redox-active protein YtxJ n=1 Tax=Flavobacterium tibetense TaxID=2233533 RepID=A0A365NYN9_9FLAO|nr:bacillithiol system redox-active protein YtxJ [Flavobacterium tibetense]RBA27329.1 bacillithiol system redox-active protein YtxJ [Flavobacterium tibetense]
MSFFSKLFNENQSDSSGNAIDWIPLQTLEQVDEIIENSHEKPILIFKHSTRCSISRFALKRFENEFELQEKVITYFLDLMNYREISNEIAFKFGIQHQSPQVLLLKNGKVVHHDSHDGIEAEELKKYI